MTRGERNCNPLNIRRTADRWLGMADYQSDKEFIQFTHVEFGIRAAIKLIRKYITHYTCNTIRKIISRWAPPSENDSESYIRYVSKHAGIVADKEIKSTDINEISEIISAMAKMESDMVLTPAYVKEVWYKYFNN